MCLDRWVKRKAEAENKRMRREARKKASQHVRDCVNFVKRCPVPTLCELLSYMVLQAGPSSAEAPGRAAPALPVISLSV